MDFPGLIHRGAGIEDVTAMVENYVAKPQSLLLLVGEAKQDAELAKALELAEKYDKHGRRTLRVLSKFDNFDSNDAKATACSTVAKEVDMTLGAHAVACRVAGYEGYDEDTEIDTLKTKFGIGATAAGTRLGVAALKARLPDLLVRLVRSNLPALEKQAQHKLEKAERAMRLLGDRSLEPLEMLMLVKTALKKASPKLTELVTPAMEAFREEVHETLSVKVDNAFVTAHFSFDAFSAPFFQGTTAFEAAMRAAVALLKYPQDKLVKAVAKLLDEALAAFNHTPGVSTRLRKAIAVEWRKAAASMLNKLRAETEAALHAIVKFGTQNHYVYDKYIEEEVVPDEVFEDIKEQLDIWEETGTSRHLFVPEGQDKGEHHKDIAADEIVRAIKKARVTYCSESGRASVAEHCAARVFRAVKAHCEVEKKSLVDNVLKAVRDVVVEQHALFVHTTLLTSADVLANAVEDSDVEQRRRALGDEAAAMRTVLGQIEELRAIGEEEVGDDALAAPAEGPEAEKE